MQLLFLRGQSWLKTKTNVQILDTPGILWPKFSDQEVGYKLAACGAIKADIFHPDDVALFVIEFLKQNYRDDLVKFARISSEEMDSLSNPDLLLALTNKYGKPSENDILVFWGDRLTAVLLSHEYGKSNGGEMRHYVNLEYTDLTLFKEAQNIIQNEL